MITSNNKKPPTGLCGGSVHDWERGLDPWHCAAFKGIGLTDRELDRAISLDGRTPAINNDKTRKNGWFGLDWCGNAICWVPDGTEMHDT